VRAYNAAADAASRALQECPKPTIAMIRGYCIGGGTAIAVQTATSALPPTMRVFGVPAGKLGLGYRFGGVKRLG